jgi:transcriptional regulator with XRE-family HTH domain
LIREARRRAGLSQAALAERLGTTQSALARLERARTEPSFERVVASLRACGFDMIPEIRPSDDSDWSVASANLALSVDQRVRQHQAALRFAGAARAAADG